MVKQGKFTVEIVNADTKIAFPYHTSPNGENYVEIEPNAEYFVRISADSEDRVMSYISIDGKSLGYHASRTKADPAFDYGLWEYKDGQTTYHALKFAKTPVRDGGAPSVSWTGKIEVDFYEAHFMGTYELQDHSNTWNGGDISYVMGMSDPDKKKGVKSNKGSTLKVHKDPRLRNQYVKGAKLNTLTLNYCSTLGLVEAGILPKPPDFEWTMLRKHYPCGPAQRMEDCPEPQLADIICNVNGVEQVVKGWVYDLTEC